MGPGPFVLGSLVPGTWSGTLGPWSLGSGPFPEGLLPFNLRINSVILKLREYIFIDFCIFYESDRDGLVSPSPVIPVPGPGPIFARLPSGSAWCLIPGLGTWSHPVSISVVFGLDLNLGGTGQ